MSDHFKPYEFTCKDGTPVPAVLLPVLEVHCVTVLEVIRAAFGAPVTIISGFRTASYNRKIKGAKASYHIYTLRPGKFATDLRVLGHSPVEVKAVLEGLIKGGKIPKGGIGLYETFVHYDNRGWNQRWSGDGAKDA